MRALAVAGLLLSCLTSEARADDTDIAMVEARRLATRAQEHFDLGEYDRAIHDFRDAYRLVPSPGFLYNLGQSYRLMGDCVSATTMYKNYLRLSPKSKYRTMVKRHLAALDPCVRDHEQSQVMQAQLSGPHPGRASKRAGLAVGGTGIALAGVGAWLAIDAAGSTDEVMGRRHGGDDDEAPPNEPPAPEDDGHVRVATALIAGGVVATAAGATLYYLGWREERRSASFTVVPLNHGAAVSVGWSW